MDNPMKVVILAGGLGTRISEESDLKPKPMVELGGKPILWHIMKSYSYYGFHNFIILCGYKGYVIKEYFSNYYKHLADMTINLKSNEITYHENHAEPWEITLIDTGLETMTGGRVKRIKKYIDDKPFMLTYGDGLTDINFNNLLKFHQAHGKTMTMSAVQPEGKFGAISSSQEGLVNRFEEKPRGDGAWINGGFMVCQPGVLDYIDGDQTVLEQSPLNKLAKEKELVAFKHEGFWKPMDTLRDKNQLESLINGGSAPWIKW
jgi:glucose-1-phosphate cytidylyltransferase